MAFLNLHCVLLILSMDLFISTSFTPNSTDFEYSSSCALELDPKNKTELEQCQLNDLKESVNNLNILSVQNVSDSSGRFFDIIKSKFGCPQNNRYNLKHVGHHITVFSPNYPFSYPKDADCKYYFSSPPRTKMKMKCEVLLPPRPHVHKCSKVAGDVFQYSLVGDENASKDNYMLCGRYFLKTFSSRNQLLIAIRSQSPDIFSVLHPTKNFKCKVKVIKDKRGGESPTTTTLCGRARLGGRRKSAVDKILGGSPAANGQFPWRCGLQVIKGGTVSETCTCSIISNEWILTSTHCIQNQDPANVFVHVGSTTFSSAAGSSNGLTVSQVIKNNKFGTGLNDDVGVVKLSQPLVFGSTISPICLPCAYKGQQFVESKMTISGFVENPANTFTLLTKEVMTMKRPQCQQLKPINNDEICIYEPGKTDCVTMGDSGSYADFQDPATGVFYAAGVNSWGDVCGSETKPSIHQNVARFLDWIESNTGMKFCP